MNGVLHALPFIASEPISRLREIAQAVDITEPIAPPFDAKAAPGPITLKRLGRGPMFFPRGSSQEWVIRSACSRRKGRTNSVAYNRFLADAAHDRGLSIGLKNDVEQARELEPWFDWALNEESFQYGECETLSVFIQNGKAVFHVEYDSELAEFCPTTTGLGFSSLKKTLDLDAWRVPC